MEQTRHIAGGVAMIDWFDDLKVGTRYRGSEAEVSRDDIKRFAAEFDSQPFHLNEADAEKTIFEGLASSATPVVDGWAAALTGRSAAHAMVSGRADMNAAARIAGQRFRRGRGRSAGMTDRPAMMIWDMTVPIDDDSRHPHPVSASAALAATWPAALVHKNRTKE